MSLRGPLWPGMALLYGGPIMAGWAGAPMALTPLFALIFMAWLVLARPALRNPPEGWAHPAIWGQLALMMLVQIALVLGCMALGAVLLFLWGGLAIGAVWPLALSALALTQAPRLAPLNDPALQQTMDEMLQALEAMAPPPEAETLEALLDREMRPDNAQAALGQGDLRRALTQALDAGEPDLLRSTAARAIALLQIEAALVCEMPDPAEICACADRQDDETARNLQIWADAVAAIHDDWASDTVRPV